MSATNATVPPGTAPSDPTWLMGVILGNHSEPVLVTRRPRDGRR